jgi:urease accessory protein
MNNVLLSLLQLADSTLPVGGYAHSAGLETYVQKGIINSKATATEFVTQMLSNNIKFTDAALVSLAYDAAEANNYEHIINLDEECSAVKLPKEMRSASQKLGMRLMKIFQPLCTSTIAEKYRHDVDLKNAAGHYSIVFGLYAHALNIQKTAALTGFYYNATAAMVTNCVKLIPLGQQDGQQMLFSVQPLIQQLVNESIEPNLALIGLCCAGFDIRCMEHEQLYSRLYMS